jgi:transposase-like protein
MEQKMSRKRTVYTPAFKTKVVLEVLKGDKTLYSTPKVKTISTFF